MKNFNRRIFTTASIITGLLVVISLFSELEADSGQVSSNWLMEFLSGLFAVLRFPSHTLLGKLAETSTLLFCAGLVVNCLFYGLLYERIYSFIKVRKSGNKDEN